MDFLIEFPSLGKRDLRDLKKTIDGSFREWSRTYGDGIEAFFDPLYFFLVWLEKLLIAAPWPIILILVASFAYLGSRSWKLALGSVISFMLIGYFGMWKDMMATISLISVATLICIAVGIPIGILMSRYDRVQSAIEIKKVDVTANFMKAEDDVDTLPSEVEPEVDPAVEPEETEDQSDETT